jgi:peptide deformylase
MILPILKYGHPMLRQKGARIERITPQISELIDNMFETMRAAAGIGLAAQQVGHALQLTVLDLRGVKDRPSTLERDGQPADVDAFMPLVLINPQITPAGPAVPGAEGCLSFPEIFEEIVRPEAVEVTALNRDGKSYSFKAGGLLARAVQHEADHLNGILFIDRMASKDKQALKPQLEELQAATKAVLSLKGGSTK